MPSPIAGLLSNVGQLLETVAGGNTGANGAQGANTACNDSCSAPMQSDSIANGGPASKQQQQEMKLLLLLLELEIAMLQQNGSGGMNRASGIPGLGGNSGVGGGNGFGGNGFGGGNGVGGGTGVGDLGGSTGAGRFPDNWQAPAAGSLNDRIASAANHLRGESSAEGPDGGNLACAFEVNRVLKAAGLNPVGDNPNSCDSVEHAMTHGRGVEISADQAKPGDIALAPNGHHIGVVMGDGASEVLSNSSSKARFDWMASRSSWENQSSGQARYFRVTS